MIKSRLQGAPEGTYKGFMDCAAKTIKADGASALFKGELQPRCYFFCRDADVGIPSSGFGPAMARAFPANAACFLGVELSLKAMNKVL